MNFGWDVQKNVKSTRARPILNKILHHFDLKKKIPWINNKIFTKRWPQVAPILFSYEVSIVVPIDFMAILLTPASRHLFTANC